MNSFKFAAIYIIFICVSLSGCSWVSQRRSLFSSDEETKETVMVPKAQYDEVLRKYEELLRQNRGEAPADTGVATEKVDLVDDLKNATATGLNATVSVEGTEPGPAPEVEMPANYTQDGVFEDMKKLEKGKGLIAKNQYDAGLKLLREAEQSEVPAVKVYAKYYIGELLFNQGEYDLAMQIFEEIMQKHAYSGVMYKVLGKLIACSEKLKMAVKKDKYFSILHDFFEAEEGATI